MFLIDSISTQFSLQWGEQQPMVRPLPAHIQRTYIQTPGGNLELLISEPKLQSKPQSSSTPPPPPILFLHGGCGHASVWLEWMTYLHENNYPSTLYAYSARNHGASYTIPYKRMVHETSFEDILSDVAYSLNHISQLRKQSTCSEDVRPPILVGHSSGGGAAQALLSGKYKSSDPNLDLKGRTSGLCLAGAIPSFGSYDMYWNWFKQDPWFPLRSVFHMLHPNSPLSTDELVHGAFFGHLFPMARVSEFRKAMPEYESMGWPEAMVGNSLGEWWKGQNQWLDTRDIVRCFDGLEVGGDKVCVLVGKEDMMYRREMWERQCKEYREALEEVSGKKVEKHGSDSFGEPIKAVSVTHNGRVRLVLVEDSGHHVQNDVYCDQAAEAFMRWASQV